MASTNSAQIVQTPCRVPIGFAVAPRTGATTQRAAACATCNLRGLCTPCCGLTRSEMDVAGRLVFNCLRCGGMRHAVDYGLQALR